MADILTTLREFFVPDSSLHKQIMVWGTGGLVVPLDPQPLLLRAFYLSGHELETRMEAARLSLSAPVPIYLLAILQSRDSQLARMARLFRHSGTNSNATYREISGSKRTVPMNQYHEVGSGDFAWEKDAAEGHPGYFLTGDGGRRSLWRVDWIDQDAYRGPVFTLRPAALSAGFPPLNLSSILDPLRRAELSQQYDELQRCVENGAFRGVISRAKDMAEGLLPLTAGLPPSKNFSETLEKVLPLIESKQVPIGMLSYHLCEKLRYLHQRTHPERAIQSGGAVTPEMALTVVHDLQEILRDLGYLKP